LLHYSQLDLSLGEDDYFLEIIVPNEVETNHDVEQGDNEARKKKKKIPMLNFLFD
jgi:hypothetical protein